MESYHFAKLCDRSLSLAKTREPHVLILCVSILSIFIRLSILTSVPSFATGIAPNRDGNQSSTVRRHLYISDDYNGAVVEYPLDQQGLPASKPDIILNGLNEPLGLAIDAQGSLYVASEGDRAIDIFSLGAHGKQKPSRIITLHGQQPVYLAVDGRGYLYVALDFTYINVYSPGATGAAVPIVTLPIPDMINDIQVDQHGDLYVAEIGKIEVYPVVPFLNAKSTPLGTISAQGGFDAVIQGPLTVDNATNRLFFNTGPLIDQPWGNMDYGVAPLPGYRAGFLNPIIETRECVGSEGYGLSYGVAIASSILYIACVDQAQIYYYNASRYGKQRVLGEISRQYIASPANLQIWP